MKKKLLLQLTFAAHCEGMTSNQQNKKATTKIQHNNALEVIEIPYNVQKVMAIQQKLIDLDLKQREEDILLKKNVSTNNIKTTPNQDTSINNNNPHQTSTAESNKYTIDYNYLATKSITNIKPIKKLTIKTQTNNNTARISQQYIQTVETSGCDNDDSFSPSDNAPINVITPMPQTCRSSDSTNSPNSIRNTPEPQETNITPIQQKLYKPEQEPISVNEKPKSKSDISPIPFFKCVHNIKHVNFEQISSPPKNKYAPTCCCCCIIL